MKGLNQFILKIRACQNKESETKTVEKEMAKIRQKFSSTRAMDGYSKKKYIWKLLFMIILGYEVDFGQDEASTLIISGKFSEKYTGYVAASKIYSKFHDKISFLVQVCSSAILLQTFIKNWVTPSGTTSSVATRSTNRWRSRLLEHLLQKNSLISYSKMC